MRILLLGLLAFVLPATAQQAAPPATTSTDNKQTQKTDVVVLSGVATTARIADPNEQVVFNGRVMRMADYVAAVSSSSAAVQRLHTPVKHNREKDQPVPPSKPLN